MTGPLYPSLYQVNTRVWLTELSRQLARPVTLDDIPDTKLDWLAAAGFDWVWFLSVWQTGAAARAVSCSNQEWRREFQETLPDLGDGDIGGSGFAITAYTAHESLGGEAALSRLRERLRARGLRLMLDFVPNHTAVDHPWVAEHPEYYVHGTEQDLVRNPLNYARAGADTRPLVLAHGRDPYFPGWPDTWQLNYGHSDTQGAMLGELQRIAQRCDGVRCDMAMLLLPEVFQRTWGKHPEPFWPKAIQQVREKHPDFCFMAEVYWGLEWTLQQQGFNYTYDKRLYDRLRDGQARLVREHLQANLDYQNRLARFLENHDEPRAAATFPEAMHEAAAVVTFFAPGLRLFHQGQFEGRRKRVSPHLVRAPQELTNTTLQSFYAKLLHNLRSPILREGQWRLLECRPAWAGNDTFDAFIASVWQNADRGRLLVVVNYSPHHSQCYLHLPFSDLRNVLWHLEDLLTNAKYDRDGSELYGRGLFLDLAPWQYHLFQLRAG